jgi:ABC-type multidrug transport system ATPase subunit
MKNNKLPFQLKLNNTGKRFRYEWIFKNVNHTFKSGTSYALLGPNGSGKSTLMKILSGHLTPSVGEIQFLQDGKKIIADEIYPFISYSAPYIEVIEEMTLTEIIDFHSKFKPFSNGLKTNDIITLLGFKNAADKEVRFFSSGMKQRLKLALCICCQTPILLLDEPTTNLDAQGVAWYQDLMMRFSDKNRLVVVASNIEHDYNFCHETLNILDYKNQSS